MRHKYSSFGYLYVVCVALSYDWESACKENFLTYFVEYFSRRMRNYCATGWDIQYCVRLIWMVAKPNPPDGVLLFYCSTVFYQQYINYRNISDRLGSHTTEASHTGFLFVKFLRAPIKWPYPCPLEAGIRAHWIIIRKWRNRQGLRANDVIFRGFVEKKNNYYFIMYTIETINHTRQCGKTTVLRFFFASVILWHTIIVVRSDRAFIRRPKMILTPEALRPVIWKPAKKHPKTIVKCIF